MENQDFNYPYYTEEQLVGEQNVLMRKVYLWMTLALTITGFVAYYASQSYALLSFLFSSSWLYIGLWVVTLVLVLVMSARVDKMSFATELFLFVLYSVIMGILLSSVFVLYTSSTISTTFFITAGTFGSMALFGSITKNDLSRFGQVMYMALIGLIIATIVNIFVANNVLDWIISFAGVLIFVGLTAYDSQKIKKWIMQYGYDINDTTKKIALMGALSLYLDFINLFLYLLRFVGRRN